MKFKKYLREKYLEEYKEFVELWADRVSKRLKLLQEAKAKFPKRWKGKVGKSIGGAVYVHRNYENDVVPKDVLFQTKRKLKAFHYNIVKYVIKTGAITFIHSPDFDTVDEPMVGEQLLVKPDGSTRLMKPSGDPWIYHHKWLWVKDDYRGFNVEEAKRRSLVWMSLSDIDYARIGKKSFWEKNVIPKL